MCGGGEEYEGKKGIKVTKNLHVKIDLTSITLKYHNLYVCTWPWMNFLFVVCVQNELVNCHAR